MDTSSYYTLGTLGSPSSSLSHSLPHVHIDVRHTHTGRDRECVCARARVCACVCLGALMVCSINHEMMKGISFI